MHRPLKPENTMSGPKHTHHTTNILGRTGLEISAIGFGAYRIAQGVDDHRAALHHAYQHGINLVDTSANYTDGASERLIGELERELERRGGVVVVTKAGYLQGENFRISQERQAARRPFPDLVAFGEGLEHCIHPEFLADQITRSLERLGRDKIDVFLLHNPEYYLMWAAENGVPLPEARAEFYRRIQLAFQHLEKEVAQGRIEWYGVSANTFVHPADDPAFVSLAQLWNIAGELGEHRFGVVQFPFNLLETGAATEPNQANGRTVLEFARDHDLGVLINRPLNAIRDGRIQRLVEIPPPNRIPTIEEVSTAVDRLAQTEAVFLDTILPDLDMPDAMKWQFPQRFMGGSLLGNCRWQDFGPLFRWLEVLQGFIAPQTQTAVHTLSHLENLPADAREWLEGYVDTINEALTAISAYFRAITAQEMARIKAQAVQVVPDWQADTLSRTAVRALRAAPGVSCVLVGMRQTAYVDEMLAELAYPVKPINLSTYARIRSER